LQGLRCWRPERSFRIRSYVSRRSGRAETEQIQPNPLLSLCGLSDQTDEGLRQLASRNHRCMQEEAA
jgi:hypothetical protein